MKNSFLLLPHLLLCVPLFASGNADAEGSDVQYSNEKWIAGFTEYYHADGDKFAQDSGINNGLGYGAELGFRFTSHWAGRIEWSKMRLDSAIDNTELNGHKVGMDLLYYPNGSNFYLFTGIKSQDLNTSYRAANLGIGHHYHLTDHWRIVSELAGYYDFGQQYKDYSFKLGLAYSFGHKKPKPVPASPIASLDSDNDGVADSIDQCPNSENGDKVDRWGCKVNVDSDSDGVIDRDDACPNTSVEVKVDSNGCPVSLTKSLQQNLDIQFAHNSSQIHEIDEQALKTFAEFMQQYPNSTTTIIGHTSVLGSAEYNLWLSKQRAEAVKQYLVNTFNISPTRIQTEGKGEQELLDSNNTVEAHRKNRRISAYTHADITYNPAREE